MIRNGTSISFVSGQIRRSGLQLMITR